MENPPTPIHMQRIVITANGDYNFACPVGREFSFAASGTFPATLTAQYNSGFAGVKAKGTFTAAAVTALDQVQIEDTVYTFVAALTAPAVAYEVVKGANDNAALNNLIAAINGADGEGTTYGTGTVAHIFVDAFTGAADTMIVKAKSVGVYGNSIGTPVAPTGTPGTWGATDLAGGAEAADVYKPFATTALALTAAGEKFGTNVGSHNEININVAGVTASDNVTEVVLVFNVMSLQERGR